MAAPTFVRSGLLAIIGKEFRRFFTDRRLVLTTVIMPGLLIYLIYSMIGGAVTNLTSGDASYQPQVYAVNLPDSLRAITQAAGLDFQSVESSQIGSIQSQITDQQVDLLVVFPASFDEQIQNQLSGTAENAAAPDIQIFFNSARSQSTTQYGIMTALLDSYKNSLLPLFSVNASGEGFDLASSQDLTGMIYAALLPMLILVFLFSGCVAVAPESIAGEKERGTIATLLVTPLARWQLALGKIISLSGIALLSGLSSFVGMLLALPKLMGSSLDTAGGAVLYALTDYLMLLLLILSTVLVFIGLIALLSALARTVKEAGTYVMPLMIVVMLIGVSGLFSQGGGNDNLLIYLIPVFNTVRSMIGVFAFAANPAAVALTVVVNVALAALCVVALTKMFGSERFMFN
ncbi:MAG: ABC transporter permease subunit [Actinomycetia bacterium]|nr:ABC transporter permease subunit [Actinomycetes bacterium]